MGDWMGFIVDNNGYTVVYTDGACLNNGRGGARAGIGVWFRNNCPYNLSEPVVGRATNNNAEIQAITAAADQARKAGIENLKIYTDSKFAINCATKWIHRWKRNGWRTKERNAVINKEELLDMEEALHQLEHVIFEHVNSHQQNYGNDQADRLARAGCEHYKLDSDSYEDSFSESDSDY